MEIKKLIAKARDLTDWALEAAEKGDFETLERHADALGKVESTMAIFFGETVGPVFDVTELVLNRSISDESPVLDAVTCGEAIAPLRAVRDNLFSLEGTLRHD